MLYDFIYIFSVVSVFIYFYFLKNKNVKNYKLPPGPKPLMLFRNSLMYSKVRDVRGGITFLHNLLEDHKIMYVQACFVGEIIFCCKPEHAQSLMTNKDCFNKIDFLYDMMTPLTNGLLTTSGEKWRQHRKLVDSVFRTKNLNEFTKVFSKISYKIVKDLEKFSGSGQIFHMSDVLAYHFLASVIETMSNIEELPFSQEYLQLFLKDFLTEMNHTSETFTKFYTAPIKNFFFFNATAKKFRKTISDMVHKLLDVSREFQNNSDKGDDKNFLERVAELPDEDCVSEMKTIILTGFDTSVISTTYVCMMLAHHPTYQELVYKEVKEVLGDREREITPQDLSQMKLLEACINETLRLYPTVVMVGRKVSADVSLGEYTAPKDCNVLLALTALHRDDEQWEKPDEFYPEHFEPENVRKRHPYAFIPFGAGPRICIGHRYAMMSLKTTLANIIKHYYIETDMTTSDIYINRLPSLDPYPLRFKLTMRNRRY